MLVLRESWKSESVRLDTESRSRCKNRSFIFFTVLCLLVFLSMAHFGSTLSIFTVDRLGFSTTEYGFLLTANGLFVVLFQYPVALGAGRMKQYYVLMLGGFFYGIGFLYLSSVATFPLALLAMAVISTGEIIFSPVATAVVGQLAPAEKRGRYMGFFGWSETLGVSFAPLVGGVLLDTFVDTPGFVWVPIASLALIASAGFFLWGRTAKLES
jgi:MFS family permease